MVRIPVRERKREAGQAILIVLLAMSIFMLGALGFAIDGSHLYAQRMMAQAAADGAAQAGMMSIFDNTSGAWGSHTAGQSFTCGSNDTAAACKYAQGLNGFNLAGDVVTVIPNPSGVTVTGLSAADTYNLLQVVVQRSVKTTLMQFLGSSASTIKATGIAAIVQIVSPVPIIVTHPCMPGALSMNGNTSITITGGPTKSIQINSNGSCLGGGNAFSGPSSGSVDLSKAGPNGTGADFGTFGGPLTNPGDVNVGSTGHYLAPSSPILDPLASVQPPAIPSQAGSSANCTTNCNSCPGGASSCTEYKPGYYPNGINIKNATAMFDPGIYYMESGGFTTKNSTVGMCTGCPADSTTVNGMLIYDTGPASGGCDASGGFTIDTNSNDVFYGAGVSATNLTAAPSAPYYGILFFEDRNACANTHVIGQGNGCFSLVGTIYITNTLAIMQNNPSQYQTVDYHGTPCSNTQNYGEIIVSALSMQGTASLNMGLVPQGSLKIRQVALVE